MEIGRPAMILRRDLMKIKLVKDKAPFKAPIQIYDNGAIVKNPYSGETAR